MELYIAGGVGEHGRNCFYVKTNNKCFLVDCGVMASDLEDPYPYLTKEDIEKLNAVFITHSHGDHIGALSWLFDQGFKGELIASKETLSQMPFEGSNVISLESICPNGKGYYIGLSINWGRTGHCPGGVWYHFFKDDKSILFSGDYIEDSMVFECDLIRDKTADLAVIDSAYGYNDTNYVISCDKLINKTKELLDKYGLLLFPVPRYGRGVELLKLFSDNLENVNYYGDEHFLNQVEKVNKGGFWYKPVSIDVSIKLYTGENKGIVFVSNPQLKTKSSKVIAKEVINLGGYGILTGTVEKGTYGAKLLKKGKMEFIRYPVHLNYGEYLDVTRENYFKESIPYHSFDLPKEKDRYKI